MQRRCMLAQVPLDLAQTAGAELMIPIELTINQSAERVLRALDLDVLLAGRITAELDPSMQFAGELARARL